MRLYREEPPSNGGPWYVVAENLTAAVAHYVFTFEREPRGLVAITDLVTVDPAAVEP